MSYAPKRLIALVKRYVPIDKHLHAFPEAVLLDLMREAQKQVMLRTHAPVTRKQITVPVAAVGSERTVNLPDDFMYPLQVRVKEPDDQAVYEGYPLEIVAHRNQDW